MWCSHIGNQSIRRRISQIWSLVKGKVRKWPSGTYCLNLVILGKKISLKIWWLLTHSFGKKSFLWVTHDYYYYYIIVDEWWKFAEKIKNNNHWCPQYSIRDFFFPPSNKPLLCDKNVNPNYLVPITHHMHVVISCPFVHPDF